MLMKSLRANNNTSMQTKAKALIARDRTCRIRIAAQEERRGGAMLYGEGENDDLNIQVYLMSLGMMSYLVILV